MLGMQPLETTTLLAFAILLLALLYSSVGHAGASGYLAAMALVTQMPQDQMKAIALTLNICVGIIAAWRFMRAGHFHWQTFWPIGLAAIPMAFIGGLWTLPAIIFKPLIGLVLTYAAVMLVIRARTPSSNSDQPKTTPQLPPLPIALLCGCVLGLMAGLTGTGGGIFLSPLLLLCGWADAKRTAAVTIVFVLLNSIAGLGGVILDSAQLPAQLPFYILAAIIGGTIGSGLGARQIPGNGIRLLLAIVLLIAAGKMFLTAFETSEPAMLQSNHAQPLSSLEGGKSRIEVI
ncbi:MAG: sulfite exporter TauE/SafE family protein [Phycisphaerales bacterium]|nr:sulfite exporter TauE/SafE family protein [Phycisphaerales bacterium]